MKYLIIILLLTGCNELDNGNISKGVGGNLVFVKLANGLECYQYIGRPAQKGGLSCNWEKFNDK